MTRTLTIAGIVWLERLRRKDVYVLGILCVALLLAVMSLNVFGLGEIVRYVYDIGLLLAWVFSLIIAVTTSAQQLPQEQTRGTIFAMLAKPVSRFEVIMGKWLGAWSVSACATLIFYTLLAMVVRLKGGSVDAAVLIQGVILHCCALAIITSIAMAFSTRCNSDASASLTAVFTAGAFLILPRVPNLVLHESNALRKAGLMLIYYALPHFELFDMRQRIVHDWGRISFAVMGIIVLYALVFTAVFLIIAWLGFRKKRFPRGTLL